MFLSETLFSSYETVEMIINFVLVTILNHISELGTLFTLFDNLTFNHIILLKFPRSFSLVSPIISKSHLEKNRIIDKMLRRL